MAAQIEEGRFAELSNALVLPPVDDLRQAALYLPYALLPSDSVAARAAMVRGMQQAMHFKHICTLLGTAFA